MRLTCCAAVALGVASVDAAARRPSSDRAARDSDTQSGSVPTRAGRRLRLATDLGNVRVRVGSPNVVSYRVDVETDLPYAGAALRQITVSAHADSEGVVISGHAAGRKRLYGRLGVSFVVEVPQVYNLEISTQGGNIETGDIIGRVTLGTAGGNITAGRLGGSARLETDGGHIVVRDVVGDLVARTAGGHITVGNIQGDATLETGGGHIRAGVIGGTAHLQTGGGNISLERAGGGIIATTGGGQIELGEASGSLNARTGGGGIRVLRVAGPTEIQTGSGSIFLTQVAGPINASTPAGGITAWFDPSGKVEGSSRLECDSGDIIVYLPRQLPITIDAAVEEGSEHRIIVDPAFPLRVTYSDSSAGEHIVHAEGPLNGGGRTLRLKAVAGNIRLLLSEAALQIYHEQLDQFRKRLEFDRQRMERQLQERQRNQPPAPPPSGVPPAPPSPPGISISDDEASPTLRYFFSWGL